VLAALAVGAVVLLGVIGVVVFRPSGTPAETAKPAAGVPVIVPGRPGEAASVLPPDQITAPDGTAYRGAEVWFIRMMIPHHLQALRMAALAPTRAADARVRAVAERINAAQTAEVGQLRAWLATRGLGEVSDDMAGHDHNAMPGMQSDAAIAALATTTGVDFDRMFVAMMSAHHQGAIDMATEVLQAGAGVGIEQLATEIAVEQSAEIVRMREVVPS
jgi:uncharacterized protein (DUF305 family)